MRKFLALVLIAASMLCLFGCENNPVPETEPSIAAPTDPIPEQTEPVVTEPTEPDPVLDTTKLYGIDVSGMTAEQAKAAITESIAAYKLNLKVNGQYITFTGEKLGMTLSEETFNQWFEDALAGNNPNTIGLIDYDITDALSAVYNFVAKKPKNATIAYDKETFVYSIKPHEDGIDADITPAKKALGDAISTLSPYHSVTISTEPVEAEIKEDDPRLNEAIKKAHEYLDLDITYTYNPKNIPSYSESISRETLASFIYIAKDLSVVLDSTAVLRFVTSKGEELSGGATRGFTTSHGTVIKLDVEYYDNMIDIESMYDDLMNCLENKVTPHEGTVEFLDAEESNMAFGGSYIEIDLNNQCLWLYKDGMLITSTPLTSGNVLYGYYTPTGVYSIQKKSTCVTLTGPTWASYVTYWMPFFGAYGLHDATWRTNFGGSEYLRDGSHGCVNLPYAQAEIIFNNISVGTKVIIYGGARSMDPMDQTLYGKSSYDLSTDSKSFNLNISATFTEPIFTYQSSNENVVTVDSVGNVTVVGAGEATITVTSPALGYVKEATYTIAITVAGDPVETEPEETTPEETEPEDTQPDVTEPSAPEETVPDETEPQITEPIASESEATSSDL